VPPVKEDQLQEGYTSWKQVAGYFDGDGNVGIEVVKKVLRFKIRFVDTWKPQIRSIEYFLSSNGLCCSSIGNGKKRGKWQPAYRLDVVEVRSVLEAARAMLPFTVKKREELQTVINYLEGRITGNDAIASFNEGVRLGRRRGKVRNEVVPYTRPDGLRLGKLENARRARAAYAVDVKPDVQEAIRRDHTDRKLGHVRLSRKYGYSVSVIRRVLGAP
jgi:hypothetical protein